MRYVIDYETSYEFEEPVREHQCEARIAPHQGGQKVHELAVHTEPTSEIHEHLDAFGNRVHWFGILPPHATLSVSMHVSVETTMANPFDFEPVAVRDEEAWLREAMWREPGLWNFLLHHSAAVPRLGELDWRDGFPAREPDHAAVDAVMHAATWVGETLRFDPGPKADDHDLTTVLKNRSGGSRDFAHLLIAVVRSWGLPARYAVGYLDPHSASKAEARSDSGTDHAWADVLIPGAGWRGFDPTNGLVVNETYVRVGIGRDDADTPSYRHSYKGDGGNESTVDISVQRAGQ